MSNFSSEEAGALPQDPIGPPSLMQGGNSERVGQFSINLSDAAPQSEDGELANNVTVHPVAFLFRLEETMSRNVSYIWTVSVASVKS